MESLFATSDVWALHTDLGVRTGPLVGEVYSPFLWPHWATGYDLLKRQRSRTVVVTDKVEHAGLFPWPEDYVRQMGADLSDVEIFHVHNGWTMSTRGLDLMAQYPDAKFVGQLIGTDINVHAAGKRANKNYRKFFERASAIVCISEFLARRAVERGCPEEKIRVIPLSVDPDRLPGTKLAADFSPPGRLEATIVARFVPVKNIEDAILATMIANLHYADTEIHLRVCGNGPLRAQLVKQADEVNDACGWEAVTVHGAARGLFPHDVAMEILRHGDCIVSCSKRMPDGAEEGLGVSIIEGQMMGLPALCYGTGGVWEIVEQNVTGWIARFPEDVGPNQRGWSNALHHDEATAAGLARAFNRLAIRRDLRVKMGREAHLRSMRFSVDAVAAATDRLYQEIA